MAEIKLTLKNAGDVKTVAEALRTHGVEWLAEIIEAQLPKAPAGEPTEPTEFGSIVRARADEFDDIALWHRGPGGGWESEDAAFVGSYSLLRDVEVLRVGVGPSPDRIRTLSDYFAVTFMSDLNREDAVRELSLFATRLLGMEPLPAAAPAEAVEADNAGLNFEEFCRLKDAIGVPLAKAPTEDQAREMLAYIERAEPSPEQVEAEPRDQIEALIAKWTEKYGYSPHALLEFASAVRELGGQQPGPSAAALAEWESDLLNMEARRDIAAAVLGAMDVDQYLIDAVVNARPR